MTVASQVAVAALGVVRESVCPMTVTSHVAVATSAWRTSRCAARSAVEDPPDHRIQVAQPVLLHRLAKLVNVPTDPPEVHAITMQSEQAFDVQHVRRSPCDGLVDHEIFGVPRSGS